MSSALLTSLAKLALDSVRGSSSAASVVRAMSAVRTQTGAVSALVFYGDADRFVGRGVGDDPSSYAESALDYLQQRLAQLRVPLAFNLVAGEVRHLTRAANKQPREYVAWQVPVTDSWTELLVLRGSWPPEAVPPLLDSVDAALPALAMILERFLGLGRREQFERQLESLSGCVNSLREASSIIGSVATMSPTMSSLPPEHLALLQDLAAAAAASLDEARISRELVESHLRLQEYASRLEHTIQTERRQATTDPVTGLLNSRGGHQFLQHAIEAASIDGKKVSVLLGDIDGFKLFNDTYGHVVGDEVLKLVGSIAGRAAGREGAASRYGGDEFLVVLPGVEKTAALHVAEECIQHLGQAEFRAPSQGFVPVSMSIGVATYPDDSSSVSSLIAIADSAMFAAKKQVHAGNVSVVRSVPDTHFSVLEGLVSAVHAKDRYTKDHCDIVAEYAVKIAERLNLPEESKRALSIAGLLHDIGKLVVPDEILKKPGALSLAEYEVMKQHVRVGEALIREVPQLKEVLQAVSCHHERYDGSGYPRGLKGQQIPLLGRIIAVADTFSAMSLDRPYRKAMTADRVLDALMRGAGTQFDPDIVREFCRLVLEERLQGEGSAA